MLLQRLRQIGILLLTPAILAGCGSILTSTPATQAPETLTKSTATPAPKPALPSRTPGFTGYSFPENFDNTKQYLFYLHGRIIEDQGIPAVSPEFGEYEYQAILERLSSFGFVVISEQRGANTDSMAYAEKIAEQISRLLEAGVPAKNITIVGASKGAGIAVYVSHILENEEVNFVIMAICHPDNVKAFIQNEINLYGNVLSIYDSVDGYAGSCQGLFGYSEGKGLTRYEEIVLHVGSGHGVLYKPMDEWILPVVEWAGKP
jgi:hypothetical protein